MRIAPFEPEHLFQIEAQSAQRPYLKWNTPEIARLAAAYFSFTGFDGQGRIVGAAGIATMEDDTLAAWALFSPLIGSHRKAVFSAVRRGLDLHATRTIYAQVAPEHDKAARFAEALDFKFIRREPHPRGTDVLLYARER